jgi:hypothetical protein
MKATNGCAAAEIAQTLPSRFAPEPSNGYGLHDQPVPRLRYSAAAEPNPAYLAFTPAALSHKRDIIEDEDALARITAWQEGCRPRPYQRRRMGNRKNLVFSQEVA